MIDIKSLTKDDIGKWVVYKSSKSSTDESEIGKLKSWNESFIFVVYKCNHDWNNFRNYTAAATAPKDLTFSVAEPMSKSDILYEGQDYEGGNKDEDV